MKSLNEDEKAATTTPDDSHRVKNSIDMNADYALFINRLVVAKNRDRKDHELSRLVSQDDLNLIYDFFINRKIPEYLLYQLNALRPGQVLRLDKKDTGLSRTLNILRTSDPDQEYQLVVETKSKLADRKMDADEKRDRMVVKANKRGKPAWRIDDTQQDIEMLNMVVKLQDSQIHSPYKYYNKAQFQNIQRTALEQVIREIEIVDDLDPQYAVALTQGEVINYQWTLQDREYEEDGHFDNIIYDQKVSLYSIKAKNDLKHYLKNSSIKHKPELQYQTIYKILQIIKHLHDRGYVHNDINLTNFLVYNNKNTATGFDIKITDFDKASPVGERNPFKPIPGYAPEVNEYAAFSYDMFRLGMMICHILTAQDVHAKVEIGKGISFAADPADAPINQLVQGLGPHGKFSQLIIGLTDPDPNARLSIHEAIQLFNQITNNKYQESLPKQELPHAKHNTHHSKTAERAAAEMQRSQNHLQHTVELKKKQETQFLAQRDNLLQMLNQMIKKFQGPETIEHRYQRHVARHTKHGGLFETSQTIRRMRAAQEAALQNLVRDLAPLRRVDEIEKKMSDYLKTLQANKAQLSPSSRLRSVLDEVEHDLQSFISEYLMQFSATNRQRNLK